MPKLGLGLSSPQTNSSSSFSLPPSSQYTGTNVLLSPRLSEFPGPEPIVEQNNLLNAGQYLNNGSPVEITGWKHYSPTFTNTGNYKSLAPKYFLKANPPYAIGGSGPAGRHLIKQFGITSTILGFNSLSRTYPDPPMRQITSSITGAGSGTTNWVKYEMYQSVNIPVGATSVKFGAMILCPPDDTLRPHNFGGVYIFAGPGAGKPPVSVNFAAICGSSVAALPGVGASYVNYEELTSNSLLMFAGPSIYSTEINRWNSNLYIKGSQQLASTYQTWKQLDVQTPLPLGNSGVDNTKIGFSMYFAESHSYLDSGATPTGSIWFYDPYVVFS